MAADEPTRDPLQIVGLVLLAIAAGCYAASLITLALRRRAGLPFGGLENEKGPLVWLLAAAGLFTSIGIFCLILVSVGERCSEPDVICYF